MTLVVGHALISVALINDKVAVARRVLLAGLFAFLHAEDRHRSKVSLDSALEVHLVVERVGVSFVSTP